jgi:hypothetical protein
MESKLGTITNLGDTNAEGTNGECLPRPKQTNEAAKDSYELGGWRRIVGAIPEEACRTGTTKSTVANFVLLAACLMLAGVTQVLAQENARAHAPEQESAPTPVQIVALDECDPTTSTTHMAPISATT